MSIEKELNNLPGELADLRRAGGYFSVIGEGSSSADIMFVGEAPGKNESETGKPFVGRAGKILNEALLNIELTREEVYITNIVKDRPPENRDPTPEEIALYSPLLDKQIEIIKPKIIATLGRFSTEYVLRRYGLESEIVEISKIHGKSFEVVTPWADKVLVFPLYHPAATIYNQKLRPMFEEDFKILKTLI